MLNAAESDTFTFRGDSTSVSFVGRAGERTSASLTRTPALEAASADFAAIAEERESLPKTGSVSDRLAAIRASLARSRTAHDELGEKALGITPEPRREAALGDEGRIANAAKIAEQLFGAPSGQAEAGARLDTPAFAKSTKIERA